MMVQKRYHTTIGQAAVEMAVLGSLILVCFSAVLNYAQQYTAQQEFKQETFRKALNKSYVRNSGVSFTAKKDARFYNTFGGFYEGGTSPLVASASVMWQKGTAGCQHGGDCSNDNNQSTFAYYEVNNQLMGQEDGATPQHEAGGLSDRSDRTIPRYEREVTDYQGRPSASLVPASPWREAAHRQSNSVSTTRKREENGTIINRQQIEIDDEINTTLFLRFDDAPIDMRSEDEHIPHYVNQTEPTRTFDDAGGETIDPLRTFTQRPFFNADTHRLEYRGEGQGGGPVTLWREWTTQQTQQQD
ncbi:hypothetical protein ACFL38_02005 [Candidatus Omnitrophota bacterium]